MALESDHAVLGGVGKPRRIWPEMHQFSVPMDYAAEVANRELGADEMLLPAEVIDAFGWAPEIAQPGPPPPAPPLEEEPSVFARRRRRQHRSESHRAPGDGDPSDQLISVDASVDDPDEVADDHGSRRSDRRQDRPRHQGRHQRPRVKAPDARPTPGRRGARPPRPRTGARPDAADRRGR